MKAITLNENIERIGIRVLFLAFTVLMTHTTFAQPVVTKSKNGMRSGDRLVKQQVEFKVSGQSGPNMFWDFSKQQAFNDHYELEHFGNEDSLMVVQEDKTLYTYILSGDSLWLSGFQDRTTRIDNQQPELQLVYPMRYGDKHISYFHGNGDYGNYLFLTSVGKTNVEADAYGAMLLPEGDTLPNVLRIHKVKDIYERMVPYPFIQRYDTIYSADSIDFHLFTDTLLLQVETYRWYADGYRYPVFETVSNRIIIRGKPMEHSHGAFYYKPLDQYYDLDNDPENQTIREEERERQSALRGRELFGNTGDNGTKPPDAPVSYNVALADDGNTLNLEYYLAEDADISILLFDMQGRQLSNEHKGKQVAGVYREHLSLFGYQPGEYTLRIVVDGTVFGIKIIK